MKIEMNATLDEIRDALAADKPLLASVHRGWGSIYDDPDVLGAVSAQPLANDPVIIPSVAGRHPDMLAARLYWYAKDTSLARVLGTSATVQATHRLKATDVLISEVVPGEFLLLITTHTAADIDHLTIPALQNVLTSIDRGATINTMTSEIDLGDVDFFLWLISKKFAGVPASALVDIDDIYEVFVQDALDQQTSIARGVNKARLELITLLASSTRTFGPAWMTMTCSSLHAACNFHLSVNGAVDVEVTSIHYSDGITASTFEKRINILTDLVYTVIPSLKEAYENDATWRVYGGRQQFRAEMKQDAVAGAKLLS